MEAGGKTEGHVTTGEGLVRGGSDEGAQPRWG